MEKNIGISKHAGKVRKLSILKYLNILCTYTYVRLYIFCIIQGYLTSLLFLFYYAWNLANKSAIILYTAQDEEGKNPKRDALWHKNSNFINQIQLNIVCVVYGKGGFFSESVILFSNLPISRKKYYKKLWYCYGREF